MISFPQSMLLKIMSEGPTTVGIFRRSPNARAMRELRERLDHAEDVDFAECSVFVAAALLKASGGGIDCAFITLWDRPLAFESLPL